MADLERRYTPVPVELRAPKEQQRKTISGYAAVFNRESSNLGGFVEVVDPRAFNKSRGDGWPDVIARYNHDDNMLLGTVAGGTLRLSIDDQGLLYDVDPPQARADILELVSRGDVRKSSFAFRTVEDDWGMTDQGFPMRTLLRAQLVDVAPVNIPAYPDSSAGLRSLAQHVGADLEEVRSLASQDELRKLFRRTDGPGPAKPQTLGAAARMALLARRESPHL
ncbi:HK97 family phage prohead protease [Streptomyces anthocyanicus]|uniref:HK97 family phage prohead protease n=1 Tax=Streptomyces TaxID=1883 RepID=UPI003415E598